MRRMMAFIWLLCGAAAVSIGIYNAAAELHGLYARLGEDPLADTHDEPGTPRRMLLALAWGAGGLLPLGIGTVMMHRGRRRRPDPIG